MKKVLHRRHLAFLLMSLLAAACSAEAVAGADVHARLISRKPADKHRAAAAVLWLKPVQDTPAAPFVSSQSYTLLQKNRTFKPHLLVVPVDSVVQFPNADPFFHNVFSLFDGKRFDLGLYEAGSTKSVTFSREGVSYIFCNIHPEMSAVILALSTRLYGIADSAGNFRVLEVPAGEYEMHVWVEGDPQPALNAFTKRVHIGAGLTDLGTIDLPVNLQGPGPHKNLYGQPYGVEASPTY